MLAILAAMSSSSFLSFLTQLIKEAAISLNKEWEKADDQNYQSVISTV